MSEEQKEAFRKSFGSDAVFEAWMEKAQRETVPETTADKLPWELGGKQPKDYTWAEFEALSAEEQMAFQNSFENLEAFDAWLQEAQNQELLLSLDLPWLNGGKAPEEYSWAEFEALTAEQQMAFQSAFETQDAFDAWLAKNENVEQMPWENGGKQPEEYTWEEFENLTAGQQMAFQNSFKNLDAFDAWMQKAQGKTKEYPWEQGGKQPEEYTWVEFEALSGEEQMAFQNAFDSSDGFDKWLQRVQQDALNLPWENGGKQPKDYTWAEFESLTGEQQMAFQNSFGSFEAFDEWLRRVNP